MRNKLKWQKSVPPAPPIGKWIKNILYRSAQKVPKNNGSPKIWIKRTSFRGSLVRGVRIQGCTRPHDLLPQSSGRLTFFSGSMKYRSGSPVGDSGSFLDMISYHNFCPDRNTKFPKNPPDQRYGLIRRFLELRIAFRIKFSG